MCFNTQITHSSVYIYPAYMKVFFFSFQHGEIKLTTILDKMSTLSISFLFLQWTSFTSPYLLKLWLLDSCSILSNRPLQHVFLTVKIYFLLSDIKAGILSSETVTSAWYYNKVTANSPTSLDIIARAIELQHTVCSDDFFRVIIITMHDSPQLRFVNKTMAVGRTVLLFHHTANSIFKMVKNQWKEIMGLRTLAVLKLYVMFAAWECVWLHPVTWEIASSLWMSWGIINWQWWQSIR